MGRNGFDSHLAMVWYCGIERTSLDRLCLLGLGVARYSDAGDEITLMGEIGWPPQIEP